MRVEILQKQEVFNKGIFRIEEAKLRHEKFDGSMSDPITRLSLERGDSAAAIAYDESQRQVVLVEQFRYPTHEKSTGWLLELPAGMVNQDTEPADTMRRELEEETGYRVKSLEHISTFYLSPGGTTERIHLYYAAVSPKDHISEGGGVIKEGEHIRVLLMDIQEALRKISSGQIMDAKTIIGLQWLQIHKLHP